MEGRGERQDLFREIAIESQPDRYFTGRTAVLGEIVRWLKARRHDGKARVVTGSPGSGKSAVLARVVTLFDRDFRRKLARSEVPRETIPPEGHVVLAIDARQKTLWDCLSAITAMVGTAANHPGLIHALPFPGRPLPLSFLGVADDLDELPWRERRWVIVLDALDEAMDPHRIAREILRFLSHVPTVRLLVGTDRELLLALELPFVSIDLDDAGYAPRADLVEYIKRRLLAKDEPRRSTPYRDHPELVDEIAEAVAERAYPVFLIARLISETLIQANEPVDRSRPRWREQFPSTVGDAFDQYLDRFGSDQRRVRDLYLPLAYAEWNGLPREGVWAALATALSGVTRTEGDVEWLLDRAGTFIVEGADDGSPVYRLAHRALADYLRRGHRAAEVQRRITDTLSEHTPDRVAGLGKDWLRASPYVRRHLATHAIRAGTLDNFLVDPLYLVATDPDFLLRALDADSRGLRPEIVDRYLGAIGDAPSIPETASYLEMVARQSGMNDLADQVNDLSLDRVFWVPWANWESRATRCDLDKVSSVAVGELEGRSVIVSGHGDSTVRRWELATGQPLGEPLRGHERGISSVAVGELEGRPVIVSGSHDETVRVWDLATGRPLGEPLRRCIGWVYSVSMGKLDSRPVIVCEGAEMTVGVWDMATGRPLTLSGNPVVTIRMWDPATGKVVGESSGGHGRMRPVTVGELEGRPVIVSGGEAETVRVWESATGRPAGGPFEGDNRISSVSVGELEGRRVAVSGEIDGTVRVCGESGQPEITIHVWDATNVVVALVPGARIVVGASSGLMVLRLNEKTVSGPNPTIPRPVPE
jgi:WD40 repeat protein